MKKILSLLFLTSSVFAMQLDIVKSDQKSHKMCIEKSSVFVPEKLGSLELYHSKKGFCVRQDDNEHEIKKYFTDPIIRNITKKQLKSFLTAGYLSINQMDNGEYSLKANGRINGGGPVLGVIAYWVTKTICYGTAVAAVSTATVATGGAVGGAIAGISAAGGVAIGTAAVTTTTAAAIGTTAGVVVGTAGAGATIASAAAVTGAIVGTTSVAGTAAVTTAAAVTSAGGIGATIAAVESLSTAVGTFFGMLPTP